MKLRMKMCKRCDAKLPSGHYYRKIEDKAEIRAFLKLEHLPNRLSSITVRDHLCRKCRNFVSDRGAVRAQLDAKRADRATS